MEMNVKELEVADYDILENIKVAILRTWKFKSIIVLSTLVGCLFFVLYYVIVGNTISYNSNATIFSAVYGSYQESVSGVSTMNVYSGLLGTYRVCDRASENLAEYGITSEQLQNMVDSGRIYLAGASTDSKKYGYTLTLVVNCSDSEKVIPITNAVAQAFADEINDLLGSNTLQVLDKATSYRTVKSINVILYLAIFGAAGFILSTLVILLVEFFSRKVFSIRQCEMNPDLILGAVPYTHSFKKD